MKSPSVAWLVQLLQANDARCHSGVSCISLETRSHDITHDLGVVCNVIAFLSGTETWSNQPDVFFHSPLVKKNMAGARDEVSTCHYKLFRSILVRVTKITPTGNATSRTRNS